MWAQTERVSWQARAENLLKNQESTNVCYKAAVGSNQRRGLAGVDDGRCLPRSHEEADLQQVLRGTRSSSLRAVRTL